MVRALRERIDKNKEPRIIILKGLRGVGKTTVLLQLFNSLENSMYFSADHPIVRDHGLFNVCEHLIEVGGYKILFIDEVHKSLNWWEDIKVISDSYPDVRLILSGSAALALHIPERRAIMLTMNPMSMSEYLFLNNGRTVLSGKEWRDWKDAAQFVGINDVESVYWRYLKVGGFPSTFNMDETDYYETVYSSILKSIREDSVTYSTLSHKKVNAMEELVNIIALSKPGEFSYTSVSNKIGVSKSVVYEIVDTLVKLGLMVFLRPYTSSSAMLRSEPKLLFSHPNLRYAVCYQLGVDPDLGAVREEFAVFNFIRLGYRVFTVKGRVKSPDYVIRKGKYLAIVEIGGRTKESRQLKTISIPDVRDRLVLKDENLITLGFHPDPTLRR